MIVFGLLAPQPAKTEYTIKFENREYPVVYATHSPFIEKKLIEKIEYKTENHKILKAIPSNLGYNCYQYARSKKNIGNGYGSLQQKISKIRTKNPTAGSVGITREGWAGHLVVVEKVKENTLIISEGNFHRGFITWREIPKSLVIGYL